MRKSFLLKLLLFESSQDPWLFKDALICMIHLIRVKNEEVTYPNPRRIQTLKGLHFTKHKRQ